MNELETRAALTHFYDALARRDGAAMAARYAPEATFEDPVFRLHGDDFGPMSTSLLSRARELRLSYTILDVGPGSGVVELTARYLFGGRRPVVNAIVSEIVFDGDRIARQVDRFDFARWAAQALGPAGRLFGRFDWFRRSVSRRARRSLGIPPSAPTV